MADYGLQITGMKYGTEKVLFDSRSVGRGTYQHAKGSVAFGSVLTTGLSDLVMINVTRPTPTTSVNILIVAKKVIYGTTCEWTFSWSGGQSGGSTSTVNGISGVNYVVLREVGSHTGYGNYGVVCNESAYLANTTGVTSFDSRQFSSTEGEVQLLPNKMYTETASGHGNGIGYGWLGGAEGGGNDYYSCHGLDWSNVTSYIRTFGIWFSTKTSGDIWSLNFSSGYPNFNNSVVGRITAMLPSYSAGGGVYLHNHTFTGTQGYSNATFPQALTPPFVGRVSLGTYDPE
jgi:hypothetical protein